jgi:tetratricopeptide (TPR) repeat protein
MISSNEFSTVHNNFKNITLFAAILLFFAVFGANQSAVFGQDELRDTVYGTAKNNQTKTKTPKKKPPQVANTPRPTTKSSPNTPKKVTPNKSVTVTFLAKEPLVEVYLNDKNIGLTDEKFQLSKKLSPGEYLLMAKNKRRVLVPTKKIMVNTDQTAFKLYDENVIKPELPTEKPVETKEKAEIEVAIEISEKVRHVLESYANPATTDSVTQEDWQIVFQAAQLGQLQNYTAVQIEAQRWFASGQIELAKGEYTNAFTAFNKAQEFMPDSALVFYALGNTYLAKKQYSDALKVYQKALQIDPKLAMAYKKLGDVQRLDGKNKEAIIAYKNAIQKGYPTPETRYWLGTLMLDTKQIEAAIQELEKVAKEMPRAEVFISIGSGYEKLKRSVSALDAYQKAIDTDPNSSLAYYKLANVYLNQREYLKAKEAFEKAIALDPDGKVLNRGEADKKLREATKNSK